MTDYYLKQMLEFNREAAKSITFQKDWILSFENVTDLGVAVKQKMLQKLIELEADNKRIKNQIDEQTTKNS
jgi:hypothetical protein